MPSLDISELALDVLIVLVTGFAAGAVCKRLGVSLVVGFLLAGVVVGEGGLGLVTQDHHELEYLAQSGALLLLFSIGIEFSPQELVHLGRYSVLGGSVQMVLAALPFLGLSLLLGLSWQAAFLIAFAASLSSTVLVFKGLTEWGHLASPAGRRAMGILLFQDVALVPLILLVPLLTGDGQSVTADAFLLLAAKSLVFLSAVGLVRWVNSRWLVAWLGNLKSTELLVLFTLTMLVGHCLGADALGLPPAIGALAAGVVLSGNRLSKQVDSLVLPYRESFAAAFFVTIGALLQPSLFLEEPLLLTLGFATVMVVKTLAGTVAMRLLGLSWQTALGAGLGLAQLGEFSFLLISDGMRAGVVSQADYNRILFIALATLIVTPQLLKVGYGWRGQRTAVPDHPEMLPEPINRAVVIGIGPIGRQVASTLETEGVDVCLVDMSPINLYPFAQEGFQTICGNATDEDTLVRAGIRESRLIVVTVPDDQTACQIARTIRNLNTSILTIVRCRYLQNVSTARRAGADYVISEEMLAVGEMLRHCEKVVLDREFPGR